MVYIVSINYLEFEFMSGSTAMSFAELAKNAVVGDANVEIEIKTAPDFADDINIVEDDITEALEEVED